MKKLMLSLLAVVAAASIALAGGPVLKFGALTQSGKLGIEEIKMIHSLELASPEKGQEVVGFTIEVWKQGKLRSRAPIDGSLIHEEMRVMLSRMKAGDRVIVKEVTVKDAGGITERLNEVLQIDVF